MSEGAFVDVGRVENAVRAAEMTPSPGFVRDGVGVGRMARGEAAATYPVRAARGGLVKGGLAALLAMAAGGGSGLSAGTWRRMQELQRPSWRPHLAGYRGPVYGGGRVWSEPGSNRRHHRVSGRSERWPGQHTAHLVGASTGGGAGPVETRQARRLAAREEAKRVRRGGGA